MAKLSYKEFRDKLRAQIWPPVPGEARNLRDVHNGFFLNAMYECSKWVPCLQQNNTSVYPFCSTYVECGRSVIQLPKGFIRRVYTIANSEWCDPVVYHPWSWKKLQCWSKDLILCFEEPANTGYPPLQMGMKYAESSSDIASGRARIGAWSINRMRLYVAPWIQSNESIVVEWDGPQQTWSDDDVIDDEFWDIGVQQFIKYWVQWQHETQFGCDKDRANYFRALADEQMGYNINHCNNQLMLPEDEECEQFERWPTSDELTDDDVPSETTEYIFAGLGDLGGTGNDEATEDVADLIKGWTPELIFTTGDNQYSNPAVYTGSPLHLNYADYITSSLSTNAFWPAMGNHDYDGDSDASAFKAFFTLPKNETFYDIVKFGGLLHLIVYNSDSREPFGYQSDSKQAEWLQLKLGLSTARWKVVVWHRPGYTLKTGRYPGSPSMKTITDSLATWGADILLHGHFHAYMRMTVGALPIIINGTGGAYLDSAVDVQPSPNDIDQYVEFAPIFEYGAVKMTISHTELKSEFINTSGVVKDTLTLEKSS